MNDGPRTCPRCQEHLEDPTSAFCPTCGASVPAAPAVAPEPVAPPSGRASCPIHPGQPASDLCSRCGTFMCASCKDGRGSGLCPACRDRVEPMDFPFSRDNWSATGLIEHCWAQYKRDWVLLSVGLLILGAIGWGVSLVSQVMQGMAGLTKSPVVTVVVMVLMLAMQTVIQGLIQLGYIRVVADSLLGRKVELGGMFTQFSKAGKLLIATLLTWLLLIVPVAVLALPAALAGSSMRTETATVLIVLVSLIALVPFLYWSVGFTFVNLELALCDDVEPVDAVKRSFALVNGQRLGVYGTLFLAGCIAMIGLVACCIGVLATAALSQVVLVALYLALRNGSGLPPLTYPKPTA